MSQLSKLLHHSQTVRKQRVNNVLDSLMVGAEDSDGDDEVSNHRKNIVEKKNDVFDKLMDSVTSKHNHKAHTKAGTQKKATPTSHKLQKLNNVFLHNTATHKMVIKKGGSNGAVKPTKHIASHKAQATKIHQPALAHLFNAATPKRQPVTLHTTAPQQKRIAAAHQKHQQKPMSEHDLDSLFDSHKHRATHHVQKAKAVAPVSLPQKHKAHMLASGFYSRASVGRKENKSPKKSNSLLSSIMGNMLSANKAKKASPKAKASAKAKSYRKTRQARMKKMSESAFDDLFSSQKHKARKPNNSLPSAHVSTPQKKRANMLTPKIFSAPTKQLKPKAKHTVDSLSSVLGDVLGGGKSKAHKSPKIAKTPRTSKVSKVTKAMPKAAKISKTTQKTTNKVHNGASVAHSSTPSLSSLMGNLIATKKSEKKRAATKKRAAKLPHVVLRVAPKKVVKAKKRAQLQKKKVPVHKSASLFANALGGLVKGKAPVKVVKQPAKKVAIAKGPTAKTVKNAVKKAAAKKAGVKAVKPVTKVATAIKPAVRPAKVKSEVTRVEDDNDDDEDLDFNFKTAGSTTAPAASSLLDRMMGHGGGQVIVAPDNSKAKSVLDGLMGDI